MNWRCALSVIFLCFFAFPVIDGTLSKSDRKKKAHGKKETEQKEADVVIEPKFVDHSKEVTIANILSGHGKLCVEERKFNHPVMAYVTPWNSEGYDIAKWAAQKFTHISPVWFQFKPESKQKTCAILGTHDINSRWLADIRANNSDIQFVPRFIIDGSVPENINKFLYDEKWQTNCAQAITNFIRKNKMHGAVIEIWLQMLPLVRAEAKEELIELITDWADLFHKADLEIIVPVPAPLDHEYKPAGYVMKEEFAKIIKHVDYINVMTYDYHSDRFVGVAPFEWVRRCLEYLLSETPVSATKILMGLNFYGYALHQTTMKAVVGRDFLEYLTTESGSLYWNPKTKEHLVRTKDQGVCIYPTMASIQARLDMADYFNVGAKTMLIKRAAFHCAEMARDCRGYMGFELYIIEKPFSHSH